MARVGISVLASAELQAVRAAAKEIPRAVNTQINRRTKSEAQPIWQREIDKRVRTRLQRRVIGDTAKVTAYRQNIWLRAARANDRLSGGGSVKRLWVGAEFGAKRFPQFGPRNVNPGKVIYPAAYETVPEVAAIWAETTAEIVAEKLGG